jgi:pimeloyl-ACP methyl ester carboxylesterase
MPEIVILLHGLLMRRPALWPLARRLKRRGFTTLMFPYASQWQSPARTMERLAMTMYALSPGPVHIVAHSLGGLVAVETLNQYQHLPTGRVVCLGSPLAGSGAARGLAERNMGWLAGKSGPLLRGGLMQVPANRDIAVIAGAKSMGLGKYFGRFDGLNDGTVAVWETRLPGLRDHLVLPVSHSAMIFSEHVAELTANFLESGFFQR